MASPLRRQPFHEPIGFSPEAFRTSRRWLFSLILTLLVLTAGVVAYLLLADVI